MKITLNGTEYQLHFGVGFVRALDKIHSVDVGGIEYGTGVNMTYMKLQGSNPYILFQTLQAALIGEYDLTEEDFDKWVDSLESDKAYTSFFKELLTNLEKQRQTGTLISNYKKTLKDLEKQAESQAKTPIEQ